VIDRDHSPIGLVLTILESVKRKNRLVIVEEQWPFASFHPEITIVSKKEGFDYLDAPIYEYFCRGAQYQKAIMHHTTKFGCMNLTTLPGHNYTTHG